MDTHDIDLFGNTTPPPSDPRKMHCHSIETYHEEHEKLSQRASEILKWFKEMRQDVATDRMCRDAMFPHGDMNTVRPRITELIQANLLQ